MKDCSLKPVVQVYDLIRPVNWELQFGRNAPLDVEIGFGMGEVLRRMARDMPERNFLGIERHGQRIYKTLNAITRERRVDGNIYGNIRIVNLDARVCFERLFARESIENVYCLFPCPWPKKGHVKHRLFSRGFLKLLNSRLKPGGRVKIVTDFYPYREWVADQIQDTGFLVETNKVFTNYDTKFERKWREEGQEEFFELNLTKNVHIHVPVKEDIVLRNYHLDDFDPARMELTDLKGATTVIFKHKAYDYDRRRMTIQSIVAEECLTQHFWIVISKENGRWTIAQSGEQNYFPTPGVAKALQLVYKSACQAADHHLYA